MKDKILTIPIFFPNLCCQHKCVFCNIRKAFEVDDIPSPQDVNIILKDICESVSSNIEVGLYGGTFTGLPASEMKAYLKSVIEGCGEKLFHIRVSTRPDYINDDILKLIKEHRVNIIEIGVQTFDDDILKTINRGHTESDVYNAVSLIKKYGFKVGIQLMFGLPCETFISFKNTIEKTIELRPDLVRIHPTLVLKGSELEQWYTDGRFKPLSLDEALEWGLYAYMKFTDVNIKVHRIGLSSGPVIDKSVVAGPYSPAFGEMVLSRYRRLMLERKITKMKGVKRVEVNVPARLLSQYIGHSRENIKYFYDKYGIDVIISPDNNLENEEISVFNY
ncbi:MAG: elongator complex protein 3 [bacterium]